MPEPLEPTHIKDAIERRIRELPPVEQRAARRMLAKLPPVVALAVASAPPLTDEDVRLLRELMPPVPPKRPRRRSEQR